ncbi:motility associated factor glycosyltransferase family protein [Paenibacillus antri]|uniref:Motility associated factor glycosyltransferase family protein n=1 Tax=Paenibacillus antri TaxID=2582848 RepID=A0A5R9GBT4_9BACL|nr:6-hydroxymethylpterin diphosphokinase MptE-like protein [Paenibacillus antri]TLS50584.1 motility associated factor glycosyltransferase family protein [Paenibacillus antri]
MRIDNQAWLNRVNPELIRFMDLLSDQIERMPLQTIETKTGDVTLKLTETNGTTFFLQSQYDPDREAGIFVDGLTPPEGEFHVLFYGLGMGYHVEAFMERFPEATVSLYEPLPAVFYHYSKNRPFSKLNKKQVKHIFVELSLDIGNQSLDVLARSTAKPLWTVVHPAYRRHFEGKVNLFFERFKEILERQKFNVIADYKFQKLWTLNSILNFPYTMSTPNIMEVKRHFENKPVLVVSAGPSLKDDIESIRKIKQEKSAYILAVGSANKALLSHEIMPDAVCTYDPSMLNQKVFTDIVERNLDTIPMIFGTSVGNDTILKYTGPMLHMFTSQDHVSDYYLGDAKKCYPVFDDAPSIAVVTLEMLAHLGASPVILAGQNLAVRDDEFYSKGIQFEHRGNGLMDDERNRLVEVLSVDGKFIPTLPEFNTMRLQMEQTIEKYQLQVINTTKQGAHINGTSYVPIEQLFEDKLIPGTVVENWYKVESYGYPVDYVLQNGKRLEDSLEKQQFVLDDLLSIFQRLENAIQNGTRGGIPLLIEKMDKALDKLLKNEFHVHFCEPMVKLATKFIKSRKLDMQATNDMIERAKLVLDTYGRYVYEVHLITNEFRWVLPKVHEKIQEYTNRMQNVSR